MSADQILPGDKQADQIVLDGSEIDLAALSGIARGRLRVVADDDAMHRVARGRADFLAALEEGQQVYGATTGVGALKDVEKHGAEMLDYARALPFAHQVAVGEEVAPEVVRLAVALRLNTALSGRTGVSSEFVAFLQAMLAHDLLPVMNRRGSIGAADLGQMGQLATVMAGAGMARLKGEAMPAAEALARVGIIPHPMPPRDGLAAVAVNSYGLAQAALQVERAGLALRRGMALAMLGAQAMGLNREVWRAAMAVGLPMERALVECALQATGNGEWPPALRVHDPLSARMIVQVFAACAETLIEAAQAIRAETAHVDDNPVVLDGRVVTSGGSLLMSLSMRLASVQLALAHLARNTLNRCLLMVNGQLEGLPVNLVPPGVVATGYGPVMKLALEQAVRVTAAASPVSVLNLAVAAGLEDEAGFIPLTAERIGDQLDALEWLHAVEAMLAAQALDLRGIAPAPGLAARLQAETRRYIPALIRDLPQTAALTALRAALTAPELGAELLAMTPFSPFDEICGLASGVDSERNAAQ
ncbi:aromatic amino acid ammonia-lyase [Paracoccus sp. S1E-3]|uniref:aromatic amino acid ammonia-lyase n=1 Tax=Paracoccus sp. S1E-3 TaxID=2756130 RepID=UPI0015EF6907|nr:aromatic amino acid ammonia-lyase [Paracoccus sp. S1E-3]MBA4490663.1 aromatic amino acid lyase [Paracoccus sp. S1E-3]